MLVRTPCDELLMNCRSLRVLSAAPREKDAGLATHCVTRAAVDKVLGEVLRRHLDDVWPGLDDEAKVAQHAAAVSRALSLLSVERDPVPVPVVAEN